MAKDSSFLNERMQRFVDEYCIDFNATRAAIAAGYSEKTANRMGSENLSKPVIQKAIAEKQKSIQQKLEITHERTVLEIARLSFSDLRKVFDENGNLLPIHQWKDDAAAAISSIKILETKKDDDGTVTQTKEIKFWDKNKALDCLSKHLGLYQKENEGKEKTENSTQRKVIFEVIE